MYFGHSYTEGAVKIFHFGKSLRLYDSLGHANVIQSSTHTSVSF